MQLATSHSSVYSNFKQYSSYVATAHAVSLPIGQGCAHSGRQWLVLTTTQIE